MRSKRGRNMRDRHVRTALTAKKAKAIMMLVVALAVLALIWVFLREAERMLASRGSGDGKVEEETAEVRVSRPVQGTLRFNGTTYTYDHQIESWLLIGTDISGNEEGTGDEYHGTMADFLALAVLDKTDRDYALLQINRDTVTEVGMMTPDGKSFASTDIQICAAHWYGGNPVQGCENTVNAVSRLLGGVKIKGYYSLGMKDIGKLNHAVGGVEVTVSGDFSKEDPSLKEGETVLLTDEQAVSYLQARMTVGDGSNAGRMERQRQYMKSLFNKVKEKMKGNSAFLNDMYRELEEVAVTNMTNRDLSRIIKRVDQGTNRGIFQIEGVTRKGDSLGDGILHEEFYADADSIESVMADLYHLEKKEG